MNKNELIASIATKSGLTKSDASKAVDAFTSTVTEELSNGNDVRLIGFGKFYTANRAATTGHNPQTKQPIQIPASTQAKFKSGAGLKAAVNNK